MTQTNLPGWSEGIKKTLAKNGAHLPEQYSWHAIDKDGLFVFITEADHTNKNSSIVKLKEGYILRNIDPSGKDWSPASIRHAEEVFSAVRLAYTSNLPVKVLLTRNSRYSETPQKSTKAMMLPWTYTVVEFSGDSVETGFSYKLEIIEP